jgi:HAD superfamily hydrolase (TIGR01450 family)
LKIKGVIFDLDGTVYRGEELIPGADAAIARLKEHGVRVIYLSNKPLQTRDVYAEKLTRLGIPTAPDEVVNSSFVMTRYLEKRAPGATVFAIAETPFIEELKRAGFTISEAPDRIAWVIAAFDRTFDYRKLNIAFQAIRRGAHFVATNPDRTCPVEGGEIPDCAGVIAALEAVTEKKVEVIVGKPSPIIIEVALEILGLSATECLLAGDRIETDIRMARQSGMAAALVLSGITTGEMATRSPLKPDFILPSIASLPEMMKAKPLGMIRKKSGNGQ